MRPVRLLAVLATVLIAAVAGVSQASATTTTECQAQLAQLREHTIAAQSSFTNAKDFDSAVEKLDAAALKLSEGKNADAAQKLADYQGLLGRLSTAPKPKLSPETADALVSEAQTVVDCINAIESA